jgi:hypothetical protein
LTVGSAGRGVPFISEINVSSRASSSPNAKGLRKITFAPACCATTK